MEQQEVNLSWLVVILILSMILFTSGIIYLFMRYQLKKNALIKENKTLEQQFHQQLLQSQLEMQEYTFNIISQEIHDNVGQILSLAKVQLNILEQGETLDKSLLADTKDSVSKAMTDLRDIAKSLNSERIQQSSLSEITGQELQRINRAGFMIATITTEGEVQNMQEHKKLILFRIIQEALHNIIKHSKAKNTDVSFCYNKDDLKIEIKDNGMGFDKEVVKKNDGLGLHNIMNRAALIGGEAQINSTINEGTTITITTPYA